MKRALDVTVAVLGLVGLSPVLAVVAGLVRWRMGPPVLFRQLRPGLDEVPFELVKFRTMTEERAPDGSLLPDEERLTPLGQWLRSTSLDELPELVNVLKAEMSLVGPRPLLMEYLDEYTPAQARRHEVRPGVTGWAQVNGRNHPSWEDKSAMDVWYVDHRSFWLDLRILARTVRDVALRRGIAAHNHATSPRFTGQD